MRATVTGDVVIEGSDHRDHTNRTANAIVTTELSIDEDRTADFPPVVFQAGPIIARAVFATVLLRASVARIPFLRIPRFGSSRIYGSSRIILLGRLAAGLLLLTAMTSCGTGIGTDFRWVPLGSKEVSRDLQGADSSRVQQSRDTHINSLNYGIFSEVSASGVPDWLSSFELLGPASHRQGVVAVYPLDREGIAALSIGRSGEVIVWNVRTGASAPLTDLNTLVRAVALDPESGYLAVVPDIEAESRNVLIWSLADRSSIAELTRLHSRVTSVDFEPARSAAGQISRIAAVILGGADGKVYRWRFLERSRGEILASASKDFERYVGHAAVVSAVAYHPGGRVFFSGDWNGALNAWLAYDTDLHGGRYDENIFGRGFFTEQSNRRKANRRIAEPIEHISLDARGRYIALGLQTGQLEIWDVRGLVLRGVFDAHTGTIRGIGFNTDGSLLASYGRDDRLIVWKLIEIKEGVEQRLRLQLEEYLQLPITGITSFRFLDAEKIIAGTVSGKVIEINVPLARQKQLKQLEAKKAAEIGPEQSENQGGDMPSE